MEKSKVIFWIHFFFALVSHILIPIMFIGMVKLMFTWKMGFWISGLIIGAALFSCTYIINHITNEDGFCYLTFLENYYRKKKGMEEIENFLPRFYKKCKEIKTWILSYFK